MEPALPSSGAPTAAKRKRTDSFSGPSVSAPSTAPSKPSSSQLSINYLVRQSPEDLQLVNKDDNIPNLLQLLSAYSNILDRHESLASNLGAQPLGPILIKRFERCFDAPPKVIASHHKGAASSPQDALHSITWLEVIEFARSHPGQFTLSTFSEGKRVCQFYYPQKKLRVQISEEDFLFINSGRCQELIPPLPIWEDEEKEVGTCDVLEAKLKELTNAADMVAARTRQLGHRLKGRKAAILERRAEGGSGTLAKASAVLSATPHPSSAGSAFTAVNTATGRVNGDGIEASTASSAAVRNELLRHFESLPHNQNQGRNPARHHSIVALPDQTVRHAHSAEPAISTQHEAGGHPGDRALSSAASLSPVPPNDFAHDTMSYYTQETVPASRPSANSYHASNGHQPSLSTGSHTYQNGHTPLKHNFSRPLPAAIESSQPFRALCQSHMDGLPRGQRVIPPCDRCRRLRMDCVKNLTSCAGCTKKHARCHWRDVSRDETNALVHLMDAEYPPSPVQAGESSYANGYSHGDGLLHHSDEGLEQNEESDDDDSNPLEDLEALGDKEEREQEDEEGLRNARELARLGWEESLRSTQRPHTDAKVPDVPNAQSAENEPATSALSQTNSAANSLEITVDVSKDNADPSAVEDKPDMEQDMHPQVAVSAMPSTLPRTKTVASDLDEDHAIEETAPPTPPAFGGFRPVNAAYTTNGLQLNGSSWIGA